MSNKIILGVKPNQKKALNASNNPSSLNAVATMLDVLAGSGGNRIVTGSASYSGVGFTYDVSALTYIIQGSLYASLPTQVTLGASDPTDPRIDVILVNTLGVVSVLAGTPAPVPSKPTVDNLTEVEITFVSVPAGSTAPVITIEPIYAEDAGTPTEWAGTTDGSVDFASTNDPHTGTVSVETTSVLGSNKEIIFTPLAPYTINGGQISFWMNAKVNMSVPGSEVRVGFFNAGVLVGTSQIIGGTVASTFGFLGAIVGTYQLVTIPILAFGGLPATVDAIRFFKLAGASTTDFFLDDVQVQEGVPTPPALTAGHTIEDETVSLPQQPILDFQGAGVNVVDDAGNTKTIVTIPGGSGGSLKSGTFDGMELSVGAPTSTFSISAGTGQVADMTVTPVPSITPVSIAGFTNQAIPTLGTSELTYILITSAGAILQQNTPPTPQQFRTHIFLGKLNHANHISISSVANNPNLALGSSDAMEDLMRDGIGIINTTPIYPIVGAGLNINTNLGALFSYAANYDNDKLNPHVVSFPAYASGVTPFPYLLSNGTIDTPLTNDVEPAIFESPLGTVAAVQASKWTNQRIYATVTGSIVMMYGQTEYVSKALALEGLGSENHVLPALLTSGDNILIAIITLVQNTTDLNINSDAVIQNASKFGEFAEGSVSITATDLQAAYNNSTTPEITTDDVRGAVSYKRGTTGGDTDIVHEILNGAGDVVATIDGEGTFVGGSTTDSTGVLAGGELSVGAGGPGVAITYDIADGSGHIITATGVKTPVSWTGLTGETPIFGVSVITFVAIDSAGLVVQQSTPFSRAQSRTLIPLGVIVHVNGVNVDTINNEQEIAYNPSSSLYDAMESIGFFNVSGNIFSPNGANLTINKSLGSLFKMGSNYDTAPLDNPHVRTNAATVGGAFQYRFSDGSSGSLANTVIDPGNLDDGAGGLTAVGTNRWSVQRIYIFTSNNIKIQRGVLDYTSSDAAISGLATEPYVTEPSLAANGLFRGWLIIKEGATVLNGVDAIFLSAGKFGESGGSVGSGTTTTLQAAYDNSPDSEIVVPSGAVNAFSLEAETDGAEIVQDWKDETSSVTASMTGDGNLTVLDINGVPITSAGATTKFLNEAGSYTVPAGGGGGSAKFNHTTYSYDYVGASGTWQGTAVAAVGNTEWNDRWRVASFAGTGGADGFYINFRLPLTYVAGTDLKVSLDFSSLTGGGGGTAAIRVGLCQPQVGGAFGTEATTAYAAQNLPVPVTDSISTFVAQFSGTTLNPGDQIAVQVWRDPGNGGDTSNATLYNSSISVDEV